MKLSQLEKLVAYMRLHAGEGKDPNIQFWKARTSLDPRAGPLEADYFIQFDFHLDDGDHEDMAWRHEVITSADRVLAQQGDFDLPIKVVDFYTKEE